MCAGLVPSTEPQLEKLHVSLMLLSKERFVYSFSSGIKRKYSGGGARCRRTYKTQTTGRLDSGVVILTKLN